MLIAKKYDDGDIVSFKLITGEEIIAKVIEDNESDYVIHKPCTIVPSQQGVGMIQSLFTVDGESNITVSKSHVIMHSKSVEDIKGHYIKTTTGIELATNIA